jgi:choice-of-anchor C domain-containing protein
MNLCRQLGLLSLATFTAASVIGCGPDSREEGLAPQEDTVAKVTQASITATNGDFENGNFTGTLYTSLSAGAPNLTGWTVGGAGIDWLGFHTRANTGTRSLDLNQMDAGSVSQTLTTVPGAVYRVSFALAGNPVCAPVTKTLSVSAGNSQSTYLFNTTGYSQANPGWVNQTFRFQATSSSTTLTFASQNPGSSCGPLIDTVSISEECVPPSNGDFENGNFTGTLYTSLSAGAPNLTGWTVGGAGIDWLGSHTQANTGTRSLDLNQMDAGSVSQTFATTPGSSYQVSFALAGNPVCAPVTKALSVSASNSQSTYFFNTTGYSQANPGWVNQTFRFQATSSSTTLTFASQTPGSSCGPLIDTVSLSCPF